MIFVFWVSIVIVFYAFVGYGLIVASILFLRTLFLGRHSSGIRKEEEILVTPMVTLLVAAYNEEYIISDKIRNSLDLNYPKEKLQIIFVTDGSTDRTSDIVKGYSEICLLHSSSRLGKIAAVQRAMAFVKGEIIVFSDANTALNRDAILHLVKHYRHDRVGAVAGEKKIIMGDKADASSAGEGFYWKYESWLKVLDYKFYSNVGAAGELFSVRTSLYRAVEPDTILDDHMIAMRIAEQGKIIAYEPGAFATETASLNSKEELKRKIRIAAGGMQSIFRLKRAANPFANGRLFFQYLSHRVLRWTIVPYLLLVILISNVLIMAAAAHPVYLFLLLLQICFYSVALAGCLMERKSVKHSYLFVPYYFCLMNYAVIAGHFRFFLGNQHAAWEKSQRKAE